jgi:hypothetical protein
MRSRSAGAADSDGDKRVSVAESYRYAYFRTLSSSFAAEAAQHPSMSADFKGEGELVVTSLERSGARMRLQAELAGELLIIDDATARVMAELRMSGGAPLELALPVGDYRLIRREGTRVWAGRVRLLWQRTQAVTARDLSVELVSILSSARHLQEERLKSAGVEPTRTAGWTLGPGWAPRRGSGSCSRRASSCVWAEA